MKLSRRDWLKLTGTAAMVSALPRSLAAGPAVAPYIREAEQPMFDLTGRIKAPVRIASIEMLKNGSNYFVRTTSSDGAVGLTGTKQVEDFMPIFSNLVA